MLQIRMLFTLLSLIILSLPTITQAEEHPLSGIGLRSIGPALTSGRVSDFAFHPDHPEIHYVSMAMLIRFSSVTTTSCVLVVP